MEDIKLFFQFLHKFIQLEEEEFDQLIRPYIKLRAFKKREMLARAGEVENYMNFISKGLIRKYYKRDNEEINTQISTEGHIIHSHESFHSRTPSEYIVETIEPSRVISISYDDLEKLYTSSHKMELLQW
jgi:CRP-like cAMP-binding protein